MNQKEKTQKKETANSMYEDFIEATLNFEKPSLNKKVKYGNTSFEYADLTEVLRCIQKPLLEKGFVIIHEMLCISDKTYLKTSIRYKDGQTYSESLFPIDITNKKMQEIGSQITYLKRYHIVSLCALSADGDNDAIEIKDQKLNETINITEAQFLTQQLTKLENHERNNVFKAFKTNEVNKISKHEYPRVLSYIRKIMENKGEK